MNISVDFDDTYTRDPAMWDSFIKLAQANGHTVYCVTMRGPWDMDRIEVVDSIGKLIGKDNCIFTAGKAKGKFCFDLGICIDVWIDDMPSAVNENKKLFADFKNSDFPY
jgi:hypothetical protein